MNDDLNCALDDSVKPAMSAEGQNLEPAVAHILSIDIVCYCKFLVNGQIKALEKLSRIGHETECPFEEIVAASAPKKSATAVK